MAEAVERNNLGIIGTISEEVRSDVISSNQMLGESGVTAEMVYLEDLVPLVVETGELNSADSSS